jgi:type IV secretory pathway VirB2 component (pilin)
MAAMPAQAQVFDEAVKQGANIFASARPILQGLGMLGVLGVAAMTLVGKMPWGWAFAVIGGLVLVMLSGAIVDWVLLIADPTGAIKLAPGTTDGEFAVIAGNIESASQQLFGDTRNLMYLGATIGVISLGILGLFGRFPWGWFFTITAGLVVLGVADLIVLGFLDQGGEAISVGAPSGGTGGNNTLFGGPANVFTPDNPTLRVDPGTTVTPMGPDQLPNQ